MADVKDLTMTLEATKYQLRQDAKSGLFIIGFTVHPNDLPTDLLAATIGTRYFVSVCEIGDDEKPTASDYTIQGVNAVQSAGMLCRNPGFQEFLENECNKTYKTPVACVGDEDWTSVVLKEYLGITSRSELKTDMEARERFDELKREWNNGVMDV